MYKSLLPELKPIIFEGKSGVLHIIYKDLDHAHLFINEGIIEQVETKNLQGLKAADRCLKWISITTKFEEGVKGEYVRNEKIDTNVILSFLEAAHHNVRVIKQHIPNNSAILQINTDKLHNAKDLNKESLKTALFFNGQSTLDEVIEKTGLPERTVLIRACKLLISGCARILPNKKILEKTERIEFLRNINDKLVDLVGPVGPMLVDDAMTIIGTEPYSLTREELPQIIEEIGSHINTEDRTELMVWSSEYLSD